MVQLRWIMFVALSSCGGMVWSENRYLLFAIMP